MDLPYPIEPPSSWQLDPVEVNRRAIICEQTLYFILDALQQAQQESWQKFDQLRAALKNEMR